MYDFSFPFFQICCEVTKQVSNYSMNYFSNGKYPIPQTMIVVLCEVIKFLGTILRSRCKLQSNHVVLLLRLIDSGYS